MNFKKILISLFIVFNFLIMARTHMPLHTHFFKTLYQPVDKYLSFFSIYQDWMMFAPNPGKNINYLRADVEFLDGTTDSYIFPKTKNLSLFEKYKYGEKYRKFISEGISKNQNFFLWEDTAKYALRKLKENNYHKIPLRVKLVREWNLIPPMKSEFRLHLAAVSKFEEDNFFTYEVMK